MIKQEAYRLVKQALIQSQKAGALPPCEEALINPLIEKPKQVEHGDLACGIALKLAKNLKMSPLQIAQIIAKFLTELPESRTIVSGLEVVAPGYINFQLTKSCLGQVLRLIHEEQKHYGREQRSVLEESGQVKERILVEYVSANPTGELHIGHGRNAVYGSCLANLFKFYGLSVDQEFYVNDAGEQIAQLGACIWAIYRKSLGLGQSLIYPEDGYPEASLEAYVSEIIKGHGTTFLNLTDSEAIPKLGRIAMDIIIARQKNLLDKLGVHFDHWFSEMSLHQHGKVDAVLDQLKAKQGSYESEGAIWLKSKDLGDERDRVLRKSSGNTTYLTNDAAYHLNKLERGYTHWINVWGADHHGQVPGLKAAIQSLGIDPDWLEIIITQIVTLARDGKIVRMSKRLGTVVTLEEVMDEVGVDATRYYLAESNPSNPISFDLELAKKTSRENPAFYIQYAYARCSSILRRVQEENPDGGASSLAKALVSSEQWIELCLQFQKDATIFDAIFDTDPKIFEHQKKLVMTLDAFPEEVKEAVVLRLPGRLARYAYELANDLQKFYEVSRVIVDDPAVMQARLGLIAATRYVLANALSILGVSAPERM